MKIHKFLLVFAVVILILALFGYIVLNAVEDLNNLHILLEHCGIDGVCSSLINT